MATNWAAAGAKLKALAAFQAEFDNELSFAKDDEITFQLRTVR